MTERKNADKQGEIFYTNRIEAK